MTGAEGVDDLLSAFGMVVRMGVEKAGVIVIMVVVMITRMRVRMTGCRMGVTMLLL
jgi:hypothetical protein